MNDNLIPFNQLTEDKQREIASMGGKASGEARRLKKTMKQALIEVLNEEVKDKKGRPTGHTYQELVNKGLVKGAIEGNSSNYKAIVEMLGELNVDSEKEAPTININITDNSELERVMYDGKDS